MVRLCTVHVFNRDSEYRTEAKNRWRRYAEIVKGENVPLCPFLLEFVPGDSDEQFVKEAKTLKAILYER